ncbi:hypothetical protein HN51_046806, partial [Arachis hypogaea]
KKLTFRFPKNQLQKTPRWDTDAPKKKAKKANILVDQVDLQKAVEKEFEMALQDRGMEETKDLKN